MTTAESEARKALARLRRALEKTGRELRALSGALRHVEDADFPVEGYAGAEEQVQALLRFADEEGQRLQDKVLQGGGLEPGRIRRSSTR